MIAIALAHNSLGNIGLVFIVAVNNAISARAQAGRLKDA
jgi:hypothetical protein